MRNKRLDVLRCIAILLVIARHTYPGIWIGKAGWMGVDLFFVLSGFLISGLLFAEYKKNHSINWKRFLIRRGLKLYPAFYVFLFATFLTQLGFKQVSGLSNYLGEIFYVQNYGPYIWSHTWSLAVEEHFYILLLIFLLVLARFSSDRENPFRIMPRAFIFVAIACLASRIVTSAAIPAEHVEPWFTYRPVWVSTNDRMDSLFFGVLLGYFHHFGPHSLERALGSRRKSVALAILASVVLGFCSFLSTENEFLLTVGLSLIYLAFGIVLLLCLRMQGVLPTAFVPLATQVGRGFATVGMYSYSIYLWHAFVLTWVPVFIQRIFRLKGLPRGISLFYVLLSILFGISMSLLVEYPVLRLRDRIFPSKPQAI